MLEIKYPNKPPITQTASVKSFKDKGKQIIGAYGKSIQFNTAPPEIAKINKPNILLNITKLLSFKIFSAL